MSEEIKQACHELTKSWEAIGGGASGQYHGSDYQQGLRTAYNQCAYELKEALAGVRKPAVSQTPEPSTLASATGSMSPRCVKWGCNQVKLEWLEKDRSLQTRNGFFTAYSDGWICPICGGGYGRKPTPNEKADLPPTGARGPRSGTEGAIGG